MADIFTDRSTDYDGSGSASTATGAIIVTFSGTQGTGPVNCTLMSRSDSAEYAFTASIAPGRRTKINLASGDNYYFLAQIPSDASMDLAVANA